MQKNLKDFLRRRKNNAGMTKTVTPVTRQRVVTAEQMATETVSKQKPAVTVIDLGKGKN
jgi:hypothetical protein